MAATTTERDPQEREDLIQRLTAFAKPEVAKALMELLERAAGEEGSVSVERFSPVHSLLGLVMPDNHRAVAGTLHADLNQHLGCALVHGRQHGCIVFVERT